MCVYACSHTQVYQPGSCVLPGPHSTRLCGATALPHPLVQCQGLRPGKLAGGGVWLYGRVTLCVVGVCVCVSYSSCVRQRPAAATPLALALAANNNTQHSSPFPSLPFPWFLQGSSFFYLSYVTCQVPSNLILSRLGARTWLPLITAAWGVVATCCIFISGECVCGTERNTRRRAQ